MQTKELDVKVFRHEDENPKTYSEDLVEVQVEGHTSGCPEGSLECAFKRAVDAYLGDVKDPDFCYEDDEN